MAWGLSDYARELAEESWQKHAFIFEKLDDIRAIIAKDWFTPEEKIARISKILEDLK